MVWIREKSWPSGPRRISGSREEELAGACSIFAQPERGSNGQLLTLVGEAGIGKSRFAHELIDRLGDRAHVLAGRCLEYGEGITFWPLREALTMVAGID